MLGFRLRRFLDRLLRFLRRRGPAADQIDDRKKQAKRAAAIERMRTRHSSALDESFDRDKANER